MLPFKTIISLNRDSATPLYLQLSAQITDFIKKGVIKAGSRLPSSRELAKQLGLNRQTVVIAFDELEAQGWIEIIPRVGVLVTKEIPEKKPVAIENENKLYPAHPSFHYHEPQLFFTPPPYPRQYNFALNDGFPDVRIAPMESLMRAYRTIAKRAYSYKHLMYQDAAGSANLRQTIAQDLLETRGLNVAPENVLITRGSQMGIYLAAHLVLKRGDTVLVGERSYFAANNIFRHTGAKLVFIPIDEEGMEVDAVKKICKQEKVKLLYITPHHYHPTTVTLPAERRAKLLELASHYTFAILEDDYDYNFHYTGSPILPMASSDTTGSVIYVGSLCKTIAPAIRTGFMVAPEKFIQSATRLRKMVDRQGDTVLEEAVAEIFQDGTIRRHMKKALKLYKSRRDNLVSLLEAKLADEVTFKTPEGGMAIWATFDKKIDLAELSKKAEKKGLLLSDGSVYCTSKIHSHSTRLGFASLNFEEMEGAIDILERVVKEYKRSDHY